MAARIPKSARLTLTLNAGTNPATGAMIRKSISFGKLMPGSDAGALSAVADAVGGLLVKPTAGVTVTEIDQIM